MRMKRSLLIFSIIQFSIKTSLQQMFEFGKCPEDLKVVDDFDMARYTGVWYEQYRYLSASEIGNTCSRVNYTHTAEGPLKFSAISFNKWKEKYLANSGIVKIEGPEQSKLLIEFFKRANLSVMHWILDTDYENYAVVWSCENSSRGLYTPLLWIYTRDQHPSKNIITKSMDALKNNRCISTKFLTKTDQRNCCTCNVEEEEYHDKSKEKGSKEETSDVDEIDVIEI